MLSDAQWAVSGPLVLEVRPRGKDAAWGPAAHAGGDHLAAPRGGLACVATRYEKTAPSFMGVLCPAATMDWIKS